MTEVNETSQQPKMVESTEPKWHHFYCNPEDKVVLRSKDGIHFRASQWRLSQASAFFKNMFDTVNNNPRADSSEIIDLPYSAETIQAFLDLCGVADLVIGDHSSFAIMIELHEMGQVYDCRYVGFMRKALEDDAHGNSEALFIYASKKRGIHLGGAAMREMGPIHSNEKLWSLLERVDPAWQFKLLRLIFKVQAHPGQVVKAELKLHKWRDVWNSFAVQEGVFEARITAESA